MWGILADARVRQAAASLVSVALGARLYLTGLPLAGDILRLRADAAVYGVAAMLAIGLVVPRFGRLALPNHPMRALLIFEAATLAVLAAVAALTALSLWVAVSFAPPSTGTAAAQEASKTVIAAVAAILTALIASVSRADALSWSGKLTRAAFQKTFTTAKYRDKPDIPPLAQSDEPLELQGESGWEWEARHLRARLIEEKLTAPAPPPR